MSDTHTARQLVWLRTDLRVHDNTALNAAMAAGPTLALFVITPGQWQQHDDSPNKVDFWLRNLVELSQAFKQMNVPLLIREADTWAKVPQTLASVCKEHGIEAVHCNEEYGVNESRRDEATRDALDHHDINFTSHLDALLFAPGTVLTKSGGYFKVFSQFRKVCYERLHHSLPRVLRRPSAQEPLRIASDKVPGAVKGFPTPKAALRKLWPAGEDEASRRLKAFTSSAIDDYHHERDLPAHPGTSQLSAYMNAGVISIRQCLHAALNANQGELQSGSQGATTWISELIWREFYRHIVVGYPRVSMGRPFRPETAALPWRHSPADLAAWQEGRTGIPIIDAAMRQLVETGWMHNRLRMLVAMFLSKNLLLDWREGERFFMQHLIDGDQAANNGGWQWSASTGTDSVPYFRVFNPVTQSEKFDTQGVFLKQWLPELEKVDSKTIHYPAKAGDLFSSVEYPPPIVDLRKSRERALEAFKHLPRG